MSAGFIHAAVATSTHQRYRLCLQKYIHWCKELDLVAFPIIEQNLILFVTELSLHSSYSNIKGHLAGLKFFALLHNYHNYFPSFNRLYLVLRGIKRSLGNKFKKPKRIPVTPGMLRAIKFNLFNSSILYNDKLMTWAIVLTAFFGFLRVSEYTSVRWVWVDCIVTPM